MLVARLPAAVLFLTGLALWCAPGASGRQSPGSAPPTQPSEELPVFRATANLVTVDAVVTDKDGRHVADLTPADFEVIHAGAPQRVQHAVYVPLGSQEDVGYARTRASPHPETASAGSLSDAVRRPAERIRRTIAVVVDDLGLSFESTAFARRGLRRFVDDQVQPGDLVAIVRTSGGIGALQQFTEDKRLLHSAIERVRWTVASRSGVGAFAPVNPQDVYVDSSRAGGGFGPGERAPGSSVTEESLDQIRHRVLVAGSLGALDFVMRGMQNLPGRKAVVFISEGFDLFARLGEGRTWALFTRLMDEANRAGVVVYTIDARGLETGGLAAEDDPQLETTEIPMPGGGVARDQRLRQLLLGIQDTRQSQRRNSEEALHYLAWQTGGFAILNNNDVNDSLRRIVDDLSGYYLIGYDAPSGAPRTWDPDRIRVRVTRPGLRVRARRGFFGPADPEAPPPVLAADPLLMAALSPFSSGDLTVRLTALFGHDADSGAYVRSLLFIDPAGLTFRPGAEGRQESDAEIIQVAVGENGEVIGNWRRQLTLRLTDEQRRAAHATGIVYSTRMSVEKSGGYQIRTAVRDVATGAVGSASQFLEVPRVGRGRLAISGLLLQTKPGEEMGDEGSVISIESAGETVREDVLGRPTLRIYRPGSDVVFAYEVYDGTRGSDALDVSTALIRDGRIVHRSGPARLERRDRSSDVRVIPVGGLLSLGPKVPPGTYTLEVSVSAGTKRQAAQWIDLEVRR